MFKEIIENLDLTKIILATITLLGTGIFIGVQKHNKQTQQSGDNSTNYQSNGDIDINTDNGDTQKQQSGDNSTNMQLNNVTIVNNYKIIGNNEKEKLMTTFKSSMPSLKESAQYELNKSAKDVSDGFIDKTTEQEEKIIKKIFERLSEPNMQIAIFEAQKGYAKYGNKEKLDRLIELLIEKGKQPPGSLKDILLDDAIEKLSKMTNNQLNILSYLLAITINHPSNTLEDFHQNYVNALLQFYLSINYERLDRDIQYLMQIGCIRQISFAQNENKIIKRIKNSYTGLFAEGFTKQEFEKDYNGPTSNIIMPCISNNSLLQISALNNNVLEQICENINITQEQKEILNKYSKKILSDEKIKEILMQMEPNMKGILDNANRINNFELMPLGTLIGLKNYELVLKTNVQWEF